MVDKVISIIIIQYTTGSGNGEPYIDWLCPYCKSHNDLSLRGYENRVYCTDCWCWFEYNKGISQLYGGKCYMTYEDIDNVIDFRYNKKNIKRVKRKKHRNIRRN